MTERLTAVRDLRPGDHVYDNRTWYWLDRWPRVLRVDALARGRLVVVTTGRFFARRATETLLVRDRR